MHAKGRANIAPARPDGGMRSAWCGTRSESTGLRSGAMVLMAPMVLTALMALRKHRRRNTRFATPPRPCGRTIRPVEMSHSGLPRAIRPASGSLCGARRATALRTLPTASGAVRTAVHRSPRAVHTPPTRRQEAFHTPHTPQLGVVGEPCGDPPARRNRMERPKHHRPRTFQLSRQPTDRSTIRWTPRPSYPNMLGSQGRSYPMRISF